MRPPRLATLLLALLGAIAAVVLATRHVARRLVFPCASLASTDLPDDVLVDQIVACDGTPVRALELRAGSATRTVVLFHNNRETAESLVALGRAVRDRGFDVILAEYRGYGASPGEGPTEQGVYNDAEAVLDRLSARGVPPDRIVLWGTSLGTGVAAEMARRGRGARLVLVSPFTSIPDLVRNAIALVPADVLVPDHFDTSSKAPSIAIPTLIVHGDADEIVPFWMGERLARQLPAARLLRVSGGHHSDLLSRGNDRVLSEIAAFVD